MYHVIVSLFPSSFYKVEHKCITRIYIILLKALRGFFPYSWEDINPGINFSQMLHSARIYQLPHTNGLCCIQSTYTVEKLHWYCYNTEFACTERKASISITFILDCKLTNQSCSSPRNVTKLQENHSPLSCSATRHSRFEPGSYM